MKLVSFYTPFSGKVTIGMKWVKRIVIILMIAVDYGSKISFRNNLIVCLNIY